MTTRLLILALWALACVSLAPMPAWAAKRVALVMGNSSYTSIPALANPGNDARLMAKTLEALGFEVTLSIDADRLGMGRAIRDFGRKLRGAGKDAVGLLYYAGHGVQARGVNYLVPIGAEIETHADLSLEAVSASDVLAQMEAAGNGLNLVILDACRNDPFRGKIRGGTRGLARIQAASGSMVAFAAAPGQVAFDGTGANSPYTAALAEAMKKPGLSVEQVFKQVRVAVEDQTGGAQTPWEESSLRGEFYFNQTSGARTTSRDDTAIELTYWDTIKDSNDPELLNIYLERYPEGLFSDIARRMVERLETVEANNTQRAETTRRAADVAYWEAVSDTTDPELLRSYLKRFPEGLFVDIARLRLKQIEAQSEPEEDDPFEEQQIALAEPNLASDEPVTPESLKKNLLIEPPPVDTETGSEQQTVRTKPAKPVPPPTPKPTEDQQVALIAPEALSEAEPDPDLPRKIQTALAAFGCEPGPVDGKWGRKSNAALDRFARYAKVTLPDEPVSPDTLKLFEGREGRICPLICGARQVEQNGRCVTKTCPAGQQLTATGQCVDRTQTAPTTTRKTQQAPAATPTSRTPSKRCGDCRSPTWPKGSKSPVVRYCGVQYKEAYALGYCLN